MRSVNTGRGHKGGRKAFAIKKITIMIREQRIKGEAVEYDGLRSRQWNMVSYDQGNGIW